MMHENCIRPTTNKPISDDLRWRSGNRVIGGKKQSSYISKLENILKSNSCSDYANDANLCLIKSTCNYLVYVIDDLRYVTSNFYNSFNNSDFSINNLMKSLIKIFRTKILLGSKKIELCNTIDKSHQ